MIGTCHKCHRSEIKIAKITVVLCEIGTAGMSL